MKRVWLLKMLSGSIKILKILPFKLLLAFVPPTAKAPVVALNMAFRVYKGIRQRQQPTLAINTHGILHRIFQFYSFIFVTPWRVNRRSNTLQCKNKLTLAFWWLLVFGFLQFRIVHVLLQPLFGDIPLKQVVGIGQREQVDSAIYWLLTPFMLILCVCLGLTGLRMQGMTSVFNAACETEQRMRDKCLESGISELPTKRFSLEKIGHLAWAAVPFLVGLLVRNFAGRNPESRMLAQTHFCTEECGLCQWFWLWLDTLLGVYGAGIIVTTALILIKCTRVIASGLKFATANSQNRRNENILHTELQVLLRCMNANFRPLLKISPGMALLEVIVVNTLVFSSGRPVHEEIYGKQLAALICTTAITTLCHKCLATGELIKSECAKLMISHRNMKVRKRESKTRRKFQVLRAWKQNTKIEGKPFMIRMRSTCNKADKRGAGLKFCRSAIDLTFQALILSQ